MSSLTLGYIALHQVHGISIRNADCSQSNKLRMTGKKSAGPADRWCGSGASRDVITSSAASTVASDACLCPRLWLRLAAWYRVHVAYFMRCQSASAMLVLCHSIGEGNLISLICSLSADASVLGLWYNWCQLHLSDLPCCWCRLLWAPMLTP